jgi:hypothetical protein
MDKKEALLRLQIKKEQIIEDIENPKGTADEEWSRGRLYGVTEAIEIVKNITRASKT